MTTTPEQSYAECPTLAYGATRSDAAGYIRYLVQFIGRGFHPDTRAADYVGRGGAPLFPGRLADHLQRSIDRAVRILGDTVYDIALDELHKLDNVAE